VIDRSESVARRPGWTLAGALAEGVAGLEPGDTFCCIEFAESPRVLIGKTAYGKGSAAAALAAMVNGAPAPSHFAASTDLAAAAAAGARELGSEGGTIVLVTDGIGTSGGIWPSTDFTTHFPNCRIETRTPPGTPPENRAIAGLRAPRAAAAGTEIVVSVEAASTPGSAPPDSVSLVVRPESGAPRSLSLRLAPSGAFSRGDVALPMPEHGSLRIEARWPQEDAFPFDDRATTVINNNSQRTVAVAGAAPELLAALRRIEFLRIVEPEPGRVALDCDALVLADATPALLESYQPFLADYLRSGGAVVFAGGAAAYSPAVWSVAARPFTSQVPLAPDDSPADERDWLLLVDASGSMAGAKWEAARDAARRLAALLPPAARARGAWFKTAPGPVFDLRGDIESALSDVAPHGATDVAASLERAAALLNSTQGARRGRIILISDGLERGGGASREDARRAGDRLAAANIDIFTFAIGGDADPEYLRGLTLDGRNGRSATVTRAEDLAFVMERELSHEGMVRGGRVETYDPGGTPFAFESLPDVDWLAKTKLQKGALLLASSGGRPLLAVSPGGRVAALATVPGGERAGAYASEAIWRVVLGALARPRADARVVLSGGRAICTFPDAGDEGALRLRQGEREILLVRTAEQEFAGPAGALEPGSVELYHSAGTHAGTLFLEAAPESDLPPWRTPVIWNAGRTPEPPPRVPVVALCMAGAVLLAAGAAASAWPSRARQD
jgi:hypothetical protein